MVHTMTSSTAKTAHLDDLDGALGEVRRFWQHAGLQRRFFAELGEVVELSTLRTLRAIETMPDGEVCVGDVAGALAVDASTASRLVDQTVHAGYVTRGTSQRDRRRIVLGLSTSGTELLSRAAEVRRTLLAEMTAGWSEDEIATLGDLLCRLRDGLDRLEG